MNIIYQACKRTIQRGNYNKNKIILQLNTFLQANVISRAEYEELIKMIG